MVFTASEVDSSLGWWGFITIWTSPLERLSDLSVRPADEGQEVRKGDVLGEVSGAAASILVAERLSLNFMQRMSGIATATKEMATKVRSEDTLHNAAFARRAWREQKRRMSRNRLAFFDAGCPSSHLGDA